MFANQKVPSLVTIFFILMTLYVREFAPFWIEDLGTKAKSPHRNKVRRYPDATWATELNFPSFRSTVSSCLRKYILSTVRERDRWPTCLDTTIPVLVVTTNPAMYPENKNPSLFLDKVGKIRSARSEYLFRCTHTKKLSRWTSINKVWTNYQQIYGNKDKQALKSDVFHNLQSRLIAC